MKTKQKYRGIWSFIITMAMLTAEIYPLSIPLAVYADGEEYVVIDEENSVSAEEVLTKDNTQENDKDIAEEEFLEATPDSSFEWDGDIITAYIGDENSVVIPKRAEMIAQGAFYKNKTITSLSFEVGCLCTKIDTGAFKECVNLNSVEFPDALKVIGISAFESCSINEVTIPESVEELWSEAFYNNASLKKVTINSKEITNDANCCFAGCNIEEVILADGMKTIPQGLFSKGEVKKGIHFDIPDSVEIIGTGAFSEIENEYTVELPKKLTEIGKDAFMGSALSGEIVFPVGIKMIHTDAFYGCIDLTSVVYEGSETRWRTVTVEDGNNIVKTPMKYLGLEDTCCLDFGSDIWKFGNSRSVSMPFIIPDDLWERFRKWCGMDAWYTESDTNSIRYHKKEYDEKGHSGICHGMSVGVIANKNKWRVFGNTLHDISFSEIYSDICVMQLLQNTSRYRKLEKKFDKKSNSEKVQALIDAARNAELDGPALLSLKWKQSDYEYGHTVVIVGIEDGKFVCHDIDGKDHSFDIRIKLYDCNWHDKPDDFGFEAYKGYQDNGKSCDIYVDSTSYEWGVFYEKDGKRLTKHIITSYGDNKSIDDVENCKGNVKLVTTDKGAIFGKEKIGNPWWITDSYYSTEYEDESQFSTITTYGGDVIHITCGEENAVFECGRIISCTEEIYCSTDNEGEIGNPSFVNAMVDDNIGDVIEVVPESAGEADFSMIGHSCFYGVELNQVEKVSVSADNSMAIKGSMGSLCVTGTYDKISEGCWNTYTLIGNDVGNLDIALNGKDGIRIKGDNIDGLEVKMEDGKGNSEAVIIDDKDGDGEVEVGRKDGKNNEEEERVVSGNVPMNPVPVIDENTAELHLIKGQKFTLPDSGWTSANKKYVAISKKSVLTAKKVTAEGIKITKDGREITVFISQPKMLNKTIKLDAGKEHTISLNYDTDNLPILWYSNAPDIATISQNGMVTAHSKGTATVTAYIYGKAYTCKVKVAEPQIVQERTLHVALNKNKTVSLKGIKKPIWKPEDETVVRVKGSKFKGLKAGDTIVSTEYEGKTYQIHVYVEDPTINVAEINAKGKDKYTAVMKAGDKIPLSYNFVEQDVVFKSSKGEVAYWDDDAIVAQMPGKAKLTAKVNGKTITINVTVN